MSSFLRLAKDDLASATMLVGVPAFVRPNRARGRKALGLRYEAKVKDDFGSKYDHFVEGPWFKYSLRSSPGRFNYAQPDGLFIDAATGVVTVAEIKYSHTPDAYFQLVDKYIPIVSKFFEKGDWRIAPLEIVHWYDPALGFPVRVRMLEDPLQARPTYFGVHVARP